METKSEGSRRIQCKHESHILMCDRTQMTLNGILDSNCGSTMAEYFHPIIEIRENAGRFICPTTAPGLMMNLPELRCFDPNDCDCMRFEGLQHGVSFFGGGHTDPTHTLSPPDNLNASGHRPLVGLSEKCYCTLKMHGKLRLNAAGTYGYGVADSNARILPCHNNGRCLVLRYRRRIPRKTPRGDIDPHWYQSLDPDSYNLTGDRDGLGVYWCRQR